MATPEQKEPAVGLLAVRSVIGGTLMGLANLVPGISGGTMLLAAGVYPRFVQGIAEVTTLKFRLPSLVVLASVVASAAAGIVLLAGPIKDLVVAHRWIMYSLFIGLTLGGVPVVWKMIGKSSRAVWAGAGAGFVAMAMLAWIQTAGWGTGGASDGNIILLFLAGVAGASAMILPGVSGGYLLLVLGQYVVILGAIDAFKEALTALDVAAALTPGLTVVLPVGLGVVTGVVGVSNLLRFLLRRYEKATLGVLLGLLMGAVVGLWPFQQGVEPEPGDVIKGEVMSAETIRELDPEDYPTQFFRPAPGQVAGALALMLGGFAATALIARLGNPGRKEEPANDMMATGDRSAT